MIYQKVRDWILAEHYRTWMGHALVGFVCGFAGEQYGAGFAAGWYGYKEYGDWRAKSSVWYDYIMDWVSAVAGGLLGWWIR